MSNDNPPAPGLGQRLVRALANSIGAEPKEMGAVLIAGAYFFFILSAYYIIRPIREEMAVLSGVRNIPWLFTGTLIGMLLVHPLFTSTVSRWPRKKFVTITYRFFMANLVMFFLLLKFLPTESTIWVGRIFFVWASVFNLFVVSVFWSFLTDIFGTGQGKRLFGFIGVGGTLGGILGSAITAQMVLIVPVIQLFWVSIALLEGAVFCVKRLDAWVARNGEALRTIAETEGTASIESATQDTDPANTAAIIGGGALDGIKRVLGTPYLLAISAFMLLFTIGSTFLYTIQAELVSQTFADSAERTSVFARIDLWVNIITLFTQAFLTGRLMKWLGVGITLALLPALSILGFGALGFAPLFVVFVAFQLFRRAGNYAIARPTREVLYTVLPRGDKYKAKNFNDTFVYRAGDQVGAWSYAAFAWLGFGVSALAFVMVPVSGLWLMVALWLGREQKARAEAG